MKKKALMMRLHQTRGVTLIMVAAGLVVLLGFVALAIDLAFLEEVDAQMQRTVDAAALAGVSGLEVSRDEALQRAGTYVRFNRILNESVDLSQQDPTAIQIGVWDGTSRVFSPLDATSNLTPNSVRVRLRLESDTTPRRPNLFFAPVLGITTGTFRADAVATNNVRDPLKIMMAIDRSATMQQDTEPPGPPVTDQEPITSVKNAVNEFLTQFQPAQVVGDRVGMVSFGTHSDPFSTNSNNPVIYTDDLAAVINAVGDVSVILQDRRYHSPPDGIFAGPVDITQGATNIAAGLCSSRTEFITNDPAPSPPRSVVILSDGQATRGVSASSPNSCNSVTCEIGRPGVCISTFSEAAARSARDQARRLRSLGITVHAIRYGKDYTEGPEEVLEEQGKILMMQLAQGVPAVSGEPNGCGQFCGQYFEVEVGNENELISIFQQIFAAEGIGLVE